MIPMEKRDGALHSTISFSTLNHSGLNTAAVLTCSTYAQDTKSLKREKLMMLTYAADDVGEGCLCALQGDAT